jgi:hypothetical protein
MNPSESKIEFFSFLLAFIRVYSRLEFLMSSWREQILKEFTPQVSHLTLVADPDGLLLEEGILHGIREQGFELIPFEDHVAFRYAYESIFRSRWDHGN